MNNIDLAIIKLKEFTLCNKYQDVITSLDDSIIILDIICKEISELAEEIK